MATDLEKAPAELQEIVADADTGGRKPVGLTAKLIFGVALAWSLFQLWYASPLPFTFGIGILNDTEARALHLAFAMFLAFLAWPAFKGRSPRDHVPVVDWIFALAGAFAGSYLLFYYGELATRPGQPTTMDIVVASVGLLLLLEATRRSVGWPMSVLALLFILYAMFGSYLPEVVAHKGASLNRLLSHMWLTTGGRLRHCARRLHRHDLRIRPVRVAARSGGRRQLHDAGELRDARPSARRSRRRSRSCRPP